MLPDRHRDHAPEGGGFRGQPGDIRAQNVVEHAVVLAEEKQEDGRRGGRGDRHGQRVHRLIQLRPAHLLRGEQSKDHRDAEGKDQIGRRHFQRDDNNVPEFILLQYAEPVADADPLGEVTALVRHSEGQHNRPDERVECECAEQEDRRGNQQIRQFFCPFLSCQRQFVLL